MNRYRVAYGDKHYDVLVVKREASSITFEIEGAVHTVEVTRTPLAVTGRASVTHPTPAAPAAGRANAAATQKGLTAPMPGIIVSVLAEVGADVSAGTPLVVMEAMKMENNLTAPRAGKVKAVLVKKGQEVNGGQLLIELE